MPIKSGSEIDASPNAHYAWKQPIPIVKTIAEHRGAAIGAIAEPNAEIFASQNPWFDATLPADVLAATQAVLIPGHPNYLSLKAAISAYKKLPPNVQKVTFICVSIQDNVCVKVDGSDWIIRESQRWIENHPPKNTDWKKCDIERLEPDWFDDKNGGHTLNADEPRINNVDYGERHFFGHAGVTSYLKNYNNVKLAQITTTSLTTEELESEPSIPVFYIDGNGCSVQDINTIKNLLGIDLTGYTYGNGSFEDESIGLEGAFWVSGGSFFISYEGILKMHYIKDDPCWYSILLSDTSLPLAA